MSEQSTVREDTSSFFTPGSLRRKLQWFIQLRWFAVAGAFIYGPVLHYFFPSANQELALFICAILLLLSNLGFTVYIRASEPVSLLREERFLFLQIFVDMGLLTAMIHYSGGVENPLYFFFIFYIIITSIVTDRPFLPFVLAGIDCILFTAMALGEYYGWLNHYHIALFSQELSIVIFSLLIFYATVFVSAYIAISLIARHRNVKRLIMEKNQKLADTAEEKMQFFRFVSHELKSPIATIESTANVITDVLADKIDKEVMDLVQAIQVRTRQVLSMIKDLLDISYDQTPYIKEKKVNPCAFIQSCIEDIHPSLEAKRIHLSFRNKCPEKEDLKLDQFRLEKIFTNVLGNAIRYTPEGGTITVMTEMTDNDWVLTVADSGIGISREDQARIFDEFFRGRNAKKLVQIGTGLGMNIVKKFVEELQGTITIDSELDRGTTVIIQIPRHA